MKTTANHRSRPGAPAASAPDLVRLSLALLEADDGDSMLADALRILSESTGRRDWAALEHLGEGRYRAVVRGAPCEGDLRRLVRAACGREVWLVVDRRLTRARRLDEPAWFAVESESDAGATLPDVILAHWPPRDSTVLDDPERIADAARMIAAAVRRAARLEELRQRSCIDPLTGLLNRRGLDRLFARERSRVRRCGTALSVVYLDLNRFKSINDRFGHRVGDETLRAVAERLLGHVRASDTLARLGGDEFLLLLPDTPRHEAHGIAVRLGRVLESEPVATTAGALPVRVSWGLACSDESGFECSLIDRADRRMLRRKLSRSVETDVPFAAVEPAAIPPS